MPVPGVSDQYLFTHEILGLPHALNLITGSLPPTEYRHKMVGQLSTMSLTNDLFAVVDSRDYRSHWLRSVKSIKCDVEVTECWQNERVVDANLVRNRGLQNRNIGAH